MQHIIEQTSASIVIALSDTEVGKVLRNLYIAKYINTSLPKGNFDTSAMVVGFLY